MREKARLSKRTVDAAKPAAKKYILWDSDLAGFGLRVQPTGAKSYFISYRAGGGRRAPKRELTLGQHGVLTPDQAREAAKQKLSAITLGQDPQQERTTARNEMTIAELCTAYLAGVATTKKASTLATDRNRINAHIIPLLGRKTVSSVTKSDIERFRDDVAQGKTAKKPSEHRKRTDPMATGGKGTASRTVGLLGGIFTYAVGEGLRSDNPVMGVKRFADRRSERFLSNEELYRLAQALSEPSISPFARSVIRLLTLTGARKGEIENLKWSEVDHKSGFLRLGDTKTGQREIHISPAVKAELESVPRPCESPYVFPSMKAPGKPYKGTKKAWEKIRNEAGLPDVRLHDLRHTYASLAVNSGQSLPMIGKLLGHKDVKTTARYAHLAEASVRQAADSISSIVAGTFTPAK